MSKASDIIVVLKCDDKSIENDFPYPSDCPPSVGDDVWITGTKYRCIARSLEIESGVVTYEVTLETAK